VKFEQGHAVCCHVKQAHYTCGILLRVSHFYSSNVGGIMAWIG